MYIWGLENIRQNGILSKIMIYSSLYHNHTWHTYFRENDFLFENIRLIALLS